MMSKRHTSLVSILGFAVVAGFPMLAGCSPDADAVGAVGPDTQLQPPPAPAGLTATQGSSSAILAWSNSEGATGYRVKRSVTNGGPYTQVGATATETYSDTSVTGGVTYYYVVSSLNEAGESANSSQASITPTPPVSNPPQPAVPAAPVNLMAAAGDAQARLTWGASNGATSYQIKRATVGNGPYTQVGTTSATQYTDQPITNGTTYFYVVSASNTTGESANSGQASVVPVAPQLPPPSPPPTAFGTWHSVTPAGVDLTGGGGCGNFGTETVQSDPARPSDLYTLFHCQGIWKSTDYGATWTGPINSGASAAAVRDCAGGITIAPGGAPGAPIIYQSCIRGSGTGFWRSLDGGASWTRYPVAPSGTGRQDYYPAVVDPYDSNHLLMAGHEMNYLVESFNGGQSWSNVPLNGGMMQNGGTAAIFFINTGSASSTRQTWLWMAQAAGGSIGTWRTTNSGANWVRVDQNEHPHGASQIYQPNSGGLIYMAGVYSASGWGVLRSSDYGQTWAHVGPTTMKTVVFGTAKNLYSMYGYPIGPGGTIDPQFQLAAQPGTGNWVTPGTPAGLRQGSAQVAVVNDGTHNIFVSAMWNSGIWRYIEP